MYITDDATLLKLEIIPSMASSSLKNFEKRAREKMVPKKDGALEKSTLVPLLFFYQNIDLQSVYVPMMCSMKLKVEYME